MFVHKCPHTADPTEKRIPKAIEINGLIKETEIY